MSPKVPKDVLEVQSERCTVQWYRYIKDELMNPKEYSTQWTKQAAKELLSAWMTNSSQITSTCNDTSKVIEDMTKAVATLKAHLPQQPAGRQLDLFDEMQTL